MSVHIILEGDAALLDWKDDAITEYRDDRDVLRAVYLKGGMHSGLPAVLIAARNDVGEVAVIQMSARMFNSIAAAIRGRADYEGTPL